jgi:hypothetical protein
VPWDVEKDKAAAFLGMGLKIGLDKNLDGFVAGVNFDADWCVAEIDFVPTTIVSTNNRVRHFGFAPLTRQMLLAGADRRNELGDYCSAGRAAQSMGRCPSPPHTRKPP